MADSPYQQPPSPALGSLAQSSRLGELKAARWILIILGIINVAFHGYMVTQVEEEVDAAFKKEIAALGQGVEIDQEMLAQLKEEAVGKVRMLYALGIVVGIIFITCGFFVYMAPVPATLTGLIVYIAIQAAASMFEPSTIFRGIIFKVIVIVCLGKAVQAAFAYKREADQTGFGSAAA